MKTLKDMGKHPYWPWQMTFLFFNILSVFLASSYSFVLKRKYLELKRCWNIPSEQKCNQEVTSLLTFDLLPQRAIRYFFLLSVFQILSKNLLYSTLSSLLVPYRWKSPLPVKPEGTLGFLAVCQSVSLSVCPSDCPSVCRSTRCPSTRFSELFSAVLWDIDLKFGIWLCLDMIQIKCDFCHGWPTFTSVIAFCKNSVFRTFLSYLLWFWLEIWHINLSWHNADQVWLLWRLIYFHMSYCPSLKFCLPDFSSSFFWDIVLKFHILICVDLI